MKDNMAHQNTPARYTRIKLDGLDHKPHRTARVARDSEDPTRIYAEFPPFTAMTENQAIQLINALADVIESKQGATE